MTSIPHFAFPFARGTGGKIGTVEQDSPGHVGACAQVIARCPLGARVERPEFGWRWPYMRSLPFNMAELTDAIKRFEPRAKPTVEDVEQLAQAAIGQAQENVYVGVPSPDPTGVGMGVND